jgi:hypothetical protein
MDRLALGLSLSPKPPRADRDTGAFIQRIKKLGGPFDWRRQVGIAEDEDLALSIEYCVADTVTLAAVPGILTKRTIGSLAAKARMISAAVLITRTIVYNHDFCVPGLSLNVAQNFL